MSKEEHNVSVADCVEVVNNTFCNMNCSLRAFVRNALELHTVEIVRKNGEIIFSSGSVDSVLGFLEGFKYMWIL